MGVSPSVASLIAGDPVVGRLQEEYNMTNKQIARLYNVFCQGDKDKSGHLNVPEFHLLFSEEPSPFLTHLFTSQDINHDSFLVFSEFLNLINTFCCYSEPQMVKFAFSTFDADNSGSISEAEIRTFIETLDKGGSDFPKAAKRAMAIFDADGNGTIDFEEFSELNLRFPHLLWPAFRLQFRIQERTLGLNTWKKIQKTIKDKGKSEVKYGPRPLCPFCFCLPRPVLKEKKARAYSVVASQRQAKQAVKKNSVMYANKKLQRRSIANKTAADDVARDAAELMAPSSNRRHSSVAVGSMADDGGLSVRKASSIGQQSIMGGTASVVGASMIGTRNKSLGLSLQPDDDDEPPARKAAWNGGHKSNPTSPHQRMKSVPHMPSSGSRGSAIVASSSRAPPADSDALFSGSSAGAAKAGVYGAPKRRQSEYAPPGVKSPKSGGIMKSSTIYPVGE